MSMNQRHVLSGDLEGLEFAIADYISRWGAHLPGVTYGEIAGPPCAVANMAMSVIRKWILATWEEATPIITEAGEKSPALHEARAALSKAAQFLSQLEQSES